MSAILCRKRSFFEDLPTSPPISKRSRCSSSSPIRGSPPRLSTANAFFPRASSPSSVSPDQSRTASVVAHLQSLFPNTDKELLGRALEECGNDMDSAIKRLNELCMTSRAENLDSGVAREDIASEVGGRVSSQDLSSSDLKGSDWVELFVREMTNASSLDDARVRASRVLEFLQKSICDHVGAEIAENAQKKIMILKGQMEGVLRENAILKRAVAIQHERQKDYDEKNFEREQLKHLLAQCQEQLRKEEVKNYALMMHLKQAQQSSSIPGRFHPDIF